MIIIIGSEKGGVGKTTLAVNLCAMLATQGKDVILVDADRQASAANWASDRSENSELPKVHCMQKYDNLRASLKDLATRYEYVIVDPSGRDSKELRSGIAVADILIMPVCPSQFDLDTVPNMAVIVSEIKEEVNPELKFKAVISKASTNRAIKEADAAINYFNDFPEIELMKTIIRERIVYRKATLGGKGMSIIEMTDEKAKYEMLEFLKEILL